MNVLYRFIRSVQDTAPPVRSKWLAVTAYAALATILGAILPTFFRNLYFLGVNTWYLAFTLFGAIYGHAKWSIAQARFWDRQPPRQGEGP